jgi:hypothetical protein
MFRILLLAVLTTAITQGLFAQNTEDVIYLKTGSIIRGKIVDQLTTGKVKIELPGGSVFVFQATEIDSIRKENRLKSSIKEINQNYYRKDRGFRNMTELAIIYGVNFKNDPNGTNQDDIGMSLQTINGYQFWPYLFVGGGVGIDRFITYQQTFSPFFVRVSSEILKRKVTPYVYLDGGYSVMWKQPSNDYTTNIKNVGGAYVAAGGGVRIYTRSRASVILSAGYKMNMSSSSWSYTYENYYTYNTSRTYQRFVMNVGVSF